MLNYFSNKELLYIKFPIVFPLLYGFILFTFPQFETHLIILTIFLLAETHFGATWPFFLDKVNFDHIISKKIAFIAIPIIIVFLCLISFVLMRDLFLLIFFAANMYHVTRQSWGVCNLYCKDKIENKFQENFLYIINIFFFFVAFFRFYYPIINDEIIFKFNVFVFLALGALFIYYLMRFKYSENFLTFVTGCLIFYPTCFVNNPVHAIIMGVTMHYTQYLYLTHKVYIKRNNQADQHGRHNFKNKFFNKYIITIFIYASIMAVFSTFGKLNDDFLKALIIIPITGQMLHFYLDSQLWKFSEKHNRENILKHILN